MAKNNEIRRDELVYCDGGLKSDNLCPIAKSCLRFKQDINPKKDLHYVFAPYDFKQQKCPFKL